MGSQFDVTTLQLPEWEGLLPSSAGEKVWMDPSSSPFALVPLIHPPFTMRLLKGHVPLKRQLQGG
jgi:hypothetical protein